MLFDEVSASSQRIEESAIILYPFRNISSHSFSFPFSGISRVKDALMIQFKPLLGAGAGDVSIIPFFVNNEKKISSGCVFTLFGAEASHIEEGYSGGSADCIVWPAPLAFAGEVDGNGLITWTDGDLITTVWLEDWIPVYYKTAVNGESSAEQERELALGYMAQRGKSPFKTFLADRDDLSGAAVQESGARTLAGCPAYGQLDLSNRGANLLERREKFAATLSAVGKAAVVCGAVLLLITAGVYLNHSSLLNAGTSSMEEIYQAAFKESSRQPLGSALAKLRSLQSPDADASFNSFMRSFSLVWDKLGVSGDISIDSLRYGGDNTDVTGTARNNESIQNLRSILEAEGFTPKNDNVQQIPGGQFRFSLTISKGGR
jgi:hypothetical protein